MNNLSSKLSEDLYQGYAYGYPHKTAYRPLGTPIPLAPYWQKEDLSNLFFYMHIPFCEMRCGFCNLFTTTHPKTDLVSRYLQSLDRQMEVISDMLDAPHFSQAAFGGGTPSFLSCQELESLFSSIETHFGGFAPGTPISFETSPATIAADKLSLLKSLGISRLSIGVQSFIESETKALGRPQKRETLLNALKLINDANFPVFNIDLIYGVKGQTVQSWKSSLQTAVSYSPQELYLYPLYVRPLTGLGKLEREPSDMRPTLYQTARDYLLSCGYEQISMRLFRRHDAPVPKDQGAIHCCQEDGMIGFGAGARSYTKNLHYSSEYAVGRKGILAILEDFINKTKEDFQHADYGCLLSEDDRQRRYLIKSILRRDGLHYPSFIDEFGVSPEHCFGAELEELITTGLAEQQSDRLVLKPNAYAYSDLIGPWLISNNISQKMAAYELT